MACFLKKACSFTADTRASWRVEEPCKCSTIFVHTTKIVWAEVPSMNPVLEGESAVLMAIVDRLAVQIAHHGTTFQAAGGWDAPRWRW